MMAQNYQISLIIQEDGDADAIKFASKIAEYANDLNNENFKVQLGFPDGKPRFNVFNDGSVSVFEIEEE